MKRLSLLPPPLYANFTPRFTFIGKWFGRRGCASCAMVPLKIEGVTLFHLDWYDDLIHTPRRGSWPRSGTNRQEDSRPIGHWWLLVGDNFYPQDKTRHLFNFEKNFGGSGKEILKKNLSQTRFKIKTATSRLVPLTATYLVGVGVFIWKKNSMDGVKMNLILHRNCIFPIDGHWRQYLMTKKTHPSTPLRANQRVTPPKI